MPCVGALFRGTHHVRVLSWTIANGGPPAVDDLMELYRPIRKVGLTMVSLPLPRRARTPSIAGATGVSRWLPVLRVRSFARAQ